MNLNYKSVQNSKKNFAKQVALVLRRLSCGSMNELNTWLTERRGLETLCSIFLFTFVQNRRLVLVQSMVLT